MLSCLEKLMDENPQPKGFFDDIDLDKLLEFIERIVAIILKFLPLFL